MDDQTQVASIMNYSQDVSDAPQPEPLPGGAYPGKINHTTIRTSKQNVNNRYYEVMIRIDPEAYPATYDYSNAPDGKVLPYRRVPAMDTPHGRYAVRRWCETIGAPMGAQIDAKDWTGMDVTVHVEHEEDAEGVRREVITRVTAP